jgi:hypothetical protein
MGNLAVGSSVGSSNPNTGRRPHDYLDANNVAVRPAPCGDSAAGVVLACLADLGASIT